MLANKSGGDILSGTAPDQKPPGFRNNRKREINMSMTTIERMKSGKLYFCTDEEVEAARVEIQHDAGIGAKVG